MKTPAIIRETIPSDKAKIKEIIDLCFPRFYRFFANHSLNSDGKVLVAEIEGSLIGFAKLTEFHVGGVKYGCILWLATHPSFRRKGFAATLIKAGTQHLKGDGAEAVFASVSRRNKAFLTVFHKEGFAQMDFLGSLQLFGRGILEFYRAIWFAPSEFVLMH